VESILAARPWGGDRLSERFGHRCTAQPREGIAIASFLGCIDFTVVNTAIPAIQAEFAASIEQLQWAVTLFVMALSAFMVIAGRLASLHGRRHAMYLGLALFGCASLS
jgi:MFS family permease